MLPKLAHPHLPFLVWYFLFLTTKSHPRFSTASLQFGIPSSDSQEFWGASPSRDLLIGKGEVSRIMGRWCTLEPVACLAFFCIPRPLALGDGGGQWVPMLRSSDSGGFIHKKLKVLVAQSCPTLFDPIECSPPASSVQKGYCQGKNAGIGSHSLLQGIFPAEGWNQGLLHCRQILYRLSQLSSSCP